ncbi:MAG: hypothetical protein ACI8WB_002840 [Phenylobacterium sp.]|jgi:hypothetical protein
MLVPYNIDFLSGGCKLASIDNKYIVAIFSLLLNLSSNNKMTWYAVVLMEKSNHEKSINVRLNRINDEFDCQRSTA